MIKNSAKLQPISTDEQPGFSGQSANRKIFSANKNSFTLNFIAAFLVAQ